MTFYIGYGFKLEGNATSSYVEIANIKDIKLPKLSIGKVEATTLNQSTNIKQYLAGMRENGDMSCTAFWTAASYSTLRGQIGTAQSFKATMPDATTHYAWSGFICEVGEISVSDDKTLEFPLMFCLTSDVTVS